MYDFKDVKSTKSINRDYILSKISEAMIFGYYHGSFKIGETYRSKLRSDDKRPSAGFYISSSGKIIYNDMGRNNSNYDCFAFVQALYGISFSQALKKIAFDFGLTTNNPSIKAKSVMEKLSSFDKKMKEETKIHFIADKWNTENLEYWKQYHITKEELIANNIYPIKKLYINEFLFSNNKNFTQYALCETFKKDMKVKVYSPGVDDFKWYSNIPNNIPFGINDLKFKSNTVFIAKAQKDRLVLKKFLPDVIATQNESPASISENTETILNFNYDRKVVGWDNDYPGLRGLVLMRRRGYEPLYVPVKLRCESGIKDFSDLAKERGLKSVERLLKQNNLI